MQQTVGLHQLSLSNYRRSGIAAKDTPELRRRIQDHGFIEPIVVRPKPGEPGRFEIISNAESVIAAGKLRIDQVPVVIRDDLDDEEAIAALKARYQSITNNPIDEAEWFQEYLSGERESDDEKPNIARVARLTGKSRTHVSRSLALLKLPSEVQDLFRAGHLSAAHGRFLITLKKAADQRRLAARTVSEKLSVRQLEALASKRQDLNVPTPVRRVEKDPDILRLEREMMELLGSPFDINPEEGTVTIKYFKNLEALQGILERLGYREF